MDRVKPQKSEPTGPLSMQALADDLGVSKATVSRALNDNPNVATKTRKRVQARAKALGYTIHPYFQKLMAHQRGANKAMLPGASIAYVSDVEIEEIRRNQPITLAILEAAQSYALSAGWKIELFTHEAGDPHGTRLCRQLRSLGIQGIILGRTKKIYDAIPAAFLKFALVSDGGYWRNAPLDHVRADGVTMILESIEYLRAQGSKSLGIWVPTQFLKGNLAFNAMFRELRGWGGMQIQLVPHPIKNANEFISYIRNNQLDGLFFHDSINRNWLTMCLKTFRQDLSILEYAPPNDTPQPWATMPLPLNKQGRGLVETIIGKITTSQYGFSELSRSMVFKSAILHNPCVVDSAN